MMDYSKVSLINRKKMHSFFTWLVKFTGNTDHSFDKTKIELLNYLMTESPYRVTKKATYSEHSDKREFTGNMYAWFESDNNVYKLLLKFLNIESIFVIGGEILDCKFSFLYDNTKMDLKFDFDNITDDYKEKSLYTTLALCEYLNFKYDIYQMTQKPDSFFNELVDQYETKYIKSYESKVVIDEYTTVYKQVTMKTGSELLVDIIVLDTLHTGQLLVKITKYDFDETGMLNRIINETTLHDDNIDEVSKTKYGNVNV